MSPGFDKARASFTEHAAQAFDVSTGEVQVGPSYEEAAREHEQTVGAAWAFSAFRKDDPPEKIRGWATADGTVVTPEQNLGVLFEEAGVWTDAPQLDAAGLAERIVWAIGMNHRVFSKNRWKVPPPALQLEEDGSGELVFHKSYRQPGPGGAGGGPEQYAKCVVKLTPGHEAELEMTDVELP